MKDRELGTGTRADAQRRARAAGTEPEHPPFIVRVEGISVRDQTVRSVSIGVGDRLVWVTGLIALVVLSWFAFQIYHSASGQRPTQSGESAPAPLW